MPCRAEAAFLNPRANVDLTLNLPLLGVTLESTDWGVVSHFVLIVCVRLKLYNGFYTQEISRRMAEGAYFSWQGEEEMFPSFQFSPYSLLRTGCLKILVPLLHEPTFITFCYGSPENTPLYFSRNSAPLSASHCHCRGVGDCWHAQFSHSPGRLARFPGLKERN